mmetsp:Transcript_21441/g.32432  ORF Transcript_21441/g.32432 Transcript_21441/m.32432 type:complete len:103 (+) Transcript_21441:161-469(+)
MRIVYCNGREFTLLRAVEWCITESNGNEMLHRNGKHGRKRNYQSTAKADFRTYTNESQSKGFSPSLIDNFARDLMNKTNTCFCRRWVRGENINVLHGCGVQI